MQKQTKVYVNIPASIKTSEEIEEYFLREWGLGRVDRAEDIPADEDCEEIFDLEIKRGNV